MSDGIIKVLDKLAQQFGVAIDWTSKNVMPYVTDLFDRVAWYHIVYNLSFFLLFVAMFCGGVFLLVKASKCKVESWEDDCKNTVLVIFGLTALIAGSVLGISHFTDLLKAIFVPEIQILEMIKGMM